MHSYNHCVYNNSILLCRFLILGFTILYEFDTFLIKLRRDIFKPACFLWPRVPEFSIETVKIKRYTLDIATRNSWNNIPHFIDKKR